MVTYYLSNEDVNAYLRDFLIRLERLEPTPTVWCPLTWSGRDLLKQVLPLMRKHHPELEKKISVVGVGIDPEDRNKIKFNTKAPKDDIANKTILLLDSSIHTGGTMSRCVEEAIKLGASSIATYSLVIKRGSSFIPTFWGLMIDDRDRIYFLLDKIPNNRLDSGPDTKGGNPRKIPCVHIRRLDEGHLQKPQLKCDVISLDRVTWGDRYFDMKAGENKECTYVLEVGNKIVGYLSLHFSDSACLFVTEIAVCREQRQKGYGPILMRFADNLARQSNCNLIRLNAIGERITFYESFGYKKIPGRDPIKLDAEIYYPMEYKVMNPPFNMD
jgi:GNAT superfamily N-acetyltransferase